MTTDELAAALLDPDGIAETPCPYCWRGVLCVGEEREKHEGWHRSHEETQRRPMFYSGRRRA